MHPSPFSLLPLLLLAPTLLAQEAGSTFGHARARELAELGRLPSPRDVVVRDLVNYHRHRLPLPKAGEDVALDLRCDRAGAAVGDELWLQVGYTTAPLGDRALAPPCSVALVVDCSGSMAEAGKLTAVQAGLRAFASRLRPDDECALVAFSDDARLVHGRRTCGDGRWLLDAIDRLAPDGATNLHAGLLRGIDELATSRHRQRRVIVLTDGIANRGTTDPTEILRECRQRAETRIDVSTVGVGDNLDVRLLQGLATECRGLFHFVADGQDVQKVFVAEADALLAAAARKVQLRVELPRGLQLVRAHHEGVTTFGDRCELTLPDLNAGATGVVLLQCRVDDRQALGAAARAELRYDGADGSARTLHAEATLRGEAVTTPDTEVRKNAAIAVLAQGLADLAQQCDARRWADADRALRLARDAAERLFPGQDDDVQRVRDIARGHATTLRRYVDRFRDV